jgi:hypothetical protein
LGLLPACALPPLDAPVFDVCVVGRDFSEDAPMRTKLVGLAAALAIVALAQMAAAQIRGGADVYVAPTTAATQQDAETTTKPNAVDPNAVDPNIESPDRAPPIPPSGNGRVGPEGDPSRVARIVGKDDECMDLCMHGAPLTRQNFGACERICRRR